MVPKHWPIPFLMITYKMMILFMLFTFTTSLLLHGWDLSFDIPFKYQTWRAVNPKAKGLGGWCESACDVSLDCGKWYWRKSRWEKQGGCERHDIGAMRESRIWLWHLIWASSRSLQIKTYLVSGHELHVRWGWLGRGKLLIIAPVHSRVAIGRECSLDLLWVLWLLR